MDRSKFSEHLDSTHVVIMPKAFQEYN